MIRDRALFGKLFQENILSKLLYEKFLSSFQPGEETCPCCHTRGRCVIHGRYFRNLIDFSKGKVVYSKVSILRVRCNSCGHTHAILPDFIVPFLQYSLSFVLRVLAAYSVRKLTVKKICSHYSISPSMLYAWRDRFLQHKGEWLGVLRDVEMPFITFLIDLLSKAPLSPQLHEFYELTGRSFLQGHANPAANSDGCAFRKKIQSKPPT